MIIDHNELEHDGELEADLCIVGSGFTGLTLAHEFLQTSRRVLVIESGDEPSAKEGISDLSSMRSLGIQQVNDARISRWRGLGGSSNCWGGWNKPFASNITGTWPINGISLNTYFDRAQSLLGLTNGDFDNPSSWLPEGSQLPSFGSGLVTGVRQVRPTRLWPLTKNDFAQSRNITILKNSSVVGCEFKADTNSISLLRAGTLEGREVRLKARHFVLAAGGLANPVLLLNFNAQHANRLGNRHDMVGRYYMDHAEVTDGRLIANYCITPTFRSLKPADDPTFQRLQLHFILDSRTSEYRNFRNHALGVWEDWRECLFDASGEAPWRGEPMSDTYRMYLQYSYTPNVDSRITLDSERDRLGMLKGVIDWRIKADDQEQLGQIARAFERRFGANGIGRLALSKKAETALSEKVFNGRHHMGATRMALSEAEGVVDLEHRVFGVNNLFVTGASVFPSYDWPGPTLTALALTMRLADILKRKGSTLLAP